METDLSTISQEYEEEREFTSHLRAENEKLNLQIEKLKETDAERLEKAKKFQSLVKDMQEEQEKRNSKMAPEFFQMCMASNKINLAEKFDCNRVSDVDAEELWKLSQKQMIPMHEYW